MEKLNYLFENEQVVLHQRKDMFNFSLDTILLSNFVNFTKNTKKVVDFGTNNGAIALFLAQRSNKIEITGVEIQKAACDLANKNVELNGLKDQIKICNQSIQEFASLYHQEFDLVVCNPPFFKLDATKHKNLNESLLIARHEVLIDLKTVISCANKVLKNKAAFCIVHRPERLDEIIVLLAENNMTVKRMQLVYPRQSSEAHTVLIEARKQGNLGMKVCEPIIVHNEDGSYTKQVKEMFKRYLDE